jgi:UDP-glucose 4-epimerase
MPHESTPGVVFMCQFVEPVAGPYDKHGVMRLLIIGCAGFLGRSLSEVGARRGYEILGISRSSKPAAWPGEYLQRQVASDLDGIIQDFEPCAILHVAGPASVEASFVAPVSDLRASILTWINTLDSVRRSGLRPLILFPSSAAVYGNPERLPTAEDAAIAPISPYGFHKAACELLALEYSQCFGLDIIVCRFFSIFGHLQQRLLIWELYNQLAGPNPTVWVEGKGTESRDYLDVDDAAFAVFQLIDSQLRARNEKSYTEGHRLVVNIAGGRETRVLDLAEQLRNLVAPEKRICCGGNEMKGAPERWRADIERLRSLIPGWESKPFSLALSECVAAWQNCQHVV